MRYQALRPGKLSPSPGWVKTTILAPWVDEDFKGDRAKPGELRWFIRVQGELRWVPQGTRHAKSVTFIPALVTDNKILMEINPEYVDNLHALPEIEKQRLLHVNWRSPRGACYPQFPDWIVDAPRRIQVPPTIGGLDFGWRNPTAFVAGHVDGDDVLWITWCRYKSGVPLQIHSENIPRGLRWWCDPGSRILPRTEDGRSQRQACRHLATRGASGEKRSPKMTALLRCPLAWNPADSDRGLPRTRPLLNELGNYHYDPSKSVEEPVDEDNHACDALRYLITGLDRGRVVKDRESDEHREVARQQLESNGASPKSRRT